MSIIILIISFLLEGVLSNYLPHFLSPLFTLTSLIIIHSLLDDNEKYYKYAFLIGFVYDLFYTDTIIFHALIFLFMAFIISKLNLVLSDNYVNLILITILLIAIYRVVTYLLLVLVSTMSFSLYSLIFSILNSIIINVIYSVILFFILKRLKPKYKYY